MGDELLPYYDRELAFLRDLGKAFIESNPKIATRLSIGPDSIKDPLAEQLVQAVAYMNARIRYKLDDEFPELTDALLGIMYPHYLAPIPSLSVVQFQPEPTITSSINIHRETELETNPINGEPCRFRTCYDVELWPIKIDSARLLGPPFPMPQLSMAEQAKSLLHLSLSCTAPNLRFENLNPKKLRFFLKGEKQLTYALYELILNNPVQIAIASGSNDKAATILPAESLCPVGFQQDEGLLPYPSHAFMGYRLLTEYFSFPEKFLFFDLVFSDENNKQLTYAGAKTLSRIGDRLDLFIFSERESFDLEHSVSANNFALGCTPIVNLFKQRAEPIALTHTQPEYEVVADRRRRQFMEVYSVDEVSGSDDLGKSFKFLPFYGVHHAQPDTQARQFWIASRRPARHLDGSEIFLSLVDLDFNPAVPPETKLSIRTTCSNRNLPSKLPGTHPRLQLREGGAELIGISCLIKPTQALRSAMGRKSIWKLVSHLSLNYLSLINQEGGNKKNNEANALREILFLYDSEHAETNRRMIESITSVSSRPVTSRLRQGQRVGICRGTGITLRFDDKLVTEKDIFMLASVLERFLALYSSINSFTQLTAVANRNDKILCQWPPRAGEQSLL